ncbi:hypothetical protein C8P68_102775 [Mucilaginibacter yixingensis]|uniref:DUF4261 domain-containing protein n=1 Tax=Mucilaginibacter yixingensis TaxID=1295612 RepID=A0A2T5JDV5_9SPHI|nr:hypothetical protein [Mucilaginibacter yixingensis]PTQ99944.1 hypothetical protein C8P68_102775 [Mucilaginibacter yixingensis]
MWPFKKKNAELQKVAEAVVKTIICIPGDWKDRIEIFSRSNGELMIAGKFLADNITGRNYEIELCVADDRIALAFTAAGYACSLSSEFLSKIADHQSVLYLIGETGDPVKAFQMAEIAAKLLKVGGIGIKIETAGKAFEPYQWSKNLDFDFEDAAFNGFVVDSLVKPNGDVYSCGMHNLGLKDTIVSGLEFQEAVDLIKIFSFYQLIDKPVIKNKQTFRTGLESAYYLITEETDQPNKGIELFENPFGMWKLERLQ